MSKNINSECSEGDVVEMSEARRRGKVGALSVDNGDEGSAAAITRGTMTSRSERSMRLARDRRMSELDKDHDPDRIFLSVKTLAAQWDCSKTTVSRLLDKAGVPAFYFGRGRNGSKRYKKEDIDRYLKNLESA